MRARGERLSYFAETGICSKLAAGRVQRFGVTPDIMTGYLASSSKSAMVQQAVKAFRRAAGWLSILLSPLAGFGVNIRAANHVIHFTRTWNPAKEAKPRTGHPATGQTENVCLYPV